jgi:hypothetical protein
MAPNASERRGNAPTDAIGAPLAFLYLLERQTKGVAKFGLAHPEHHSAHADPSTHMPISGARRLGKHNGISW